MSTVPIAVEASTDCSYINGLEAVDYVILQCWSAEQSSIIIIIIIQEKINVAFSPKWTSRTRYNVKKLT